MKACRDFRKILQVHFRLCGTQDMMNLFSFEAPFLPELLRCIISSFLEEVSNFEKLD